MSDLVIVALIGAVSGAIVVSGPLILFHLQDRARRLDAEKIAAALIVAAEKLARKRVE